MPDENYAVEVNGLVKSFPEVRAVDHLSFRVAAGEILRAEKQSDPTTAPARPPRCGCWPV